MLRMTEDEYQEFLERTGQSQKRQSSESVRVSKYLNKKVYVYEDGYVSTEKSTEHGKLIEHYDSVKEYKRGLELRLMQSKGEIHSLQMQVPLLIQPAFQTKDGKNHRRIYYKADYMYKKGEDTIVEDVKGFDRKKKRYITTADFRLKWKLLQAKYPEITFRLY